MGFRSSPEQDECGVSNDPAPLMFSIKRIAILLLAGLAVGCGASPRGSEQRAGTRNAAYSTTMKAFHILQGTTEVMPRRLQLHLASILDRGSHSQLNAAHVQHARTTSGAAWVFVNGSDLCLASGRRGGVACSQMTRALEEGVSLGVFSPPSKPGQRPHDFLLMGLAPDGVTQVEVSIGKRQQKIAVQSNLFSASGDQPVMLKQFVRENS
jgi:hypothetical protein